MGSQVFVEWMNGGEGREKSDMTVGYKNEGLLPAYKVKTAGSYEK